MIDIEEYEYCMTYYSQKGCVQSHVTFKFWETMRDRDIVATED